jgi:hypothetical protein
MRHTTQAKMIIQDLKEGKAITPLMALDAYRCFRRSGRTFDLRKQGARIRNEIVYTPGGARVARYTLIADN